MKIDKAADKMKFLKYKALQGAIIVHDTYSDDYDLLNESALTALDMSIASLEAWEKVKAEIDEQYDRVHPYNISCAEGLEMALEIIDKHISGKENA